MERDPFEHLDFDDPSLPPSDFDIGYASSPAAEPTPEQRAVANLTERIRDRAERAEFEAHTVDPSQGEAIARHMEFLQREEADQQDALADLGQLEKGPRSQDDEEAITARAEARVREWLDLNDPTWRQHCDDFESD